MKTMKKLWMAASVAAISMTGCQEEQFEGRPDPDNYYASIETFGTDTRTALGEGRSVVWSSEDRIAIFEGNGAGQAYQVLNAYVGKSSGEFAEVEGLVAEGTGAAIEGTIAVYPFNEDLTVTSGDNGNYIIEGISFPAEQKYIAGSFSEEAFPMTAICEQGSKNLSFKNIGGVLKLSLTGSYSVSQITLTGNSGEPLSGPAKVTLGPDGIPSVKMSDDASTSVSLVCDPAVQLDPETATDFYISMPPTDFEAGLSITVTDSESHQTIKTTDKQNITDRSSVLAMPELSENDFEEAETEQWVDLGLSVLWAAYNVGASSPEEYGGYYAWGETSTKSDYTEENYKYYEKYYYGDEPDDWYWVGKFIGNEISGTSYDVAHVQWGGGARMPTYAEVKELVDDCTFTAGSCNGVRGSYVTGPNGNSIFLPAAGFDFKTNYTAGKSGFYWSASLSEDNRYAYYISFSKNGPHLAKYFSRCHGYTVRPVRE